MNTKVKFILTYLGGIVTGIILVIILGIIVAGQDGTTSQDENLVMFDKPQQEVKAESFKVLQVLQNGNALATIEDFPNFGTVVLFLAKDGMSYYDDQIIEIPSGKQAMQIGSYKYFTQNNTEKTVPVIDFINNK